MAKPLRSEELWERIELLLPQPKPRRFRFLGREPIDNRNALTGILFVLKTGSPWEVVLQEMECGGGMTCWPRLGDWHRAEVWRKPHEVLWTDVRGADPRFGPRAMGRRLARTRRTEPNPLANTT